MKINRIKPTRYEELQHDVRHLKRGLDGFDIYCTAEHWEAHWVRVDDAMRLIPTGWSAMDQAVVWSELRGVQKHIEAAVFAITGWCIA